MKHASPSFWNLFQKKHQVVQCEAGSPRGIEIENLTVAYPQNQVISRLNCHFEVPSLWAVVGPNGAGKSTLLRALLGLQKPTSGDVIFRGFCPCDVAYLAQQNQLDRRFPLTVGDTVAMGLFREVGMLRKYTQDQRDKMQAALEQVGLASFSKTSLQALSGGQFQRVLFARLILQDAPVIFLDEPFTGVDGRTIEDLIKLVRVWVEENRLVIAVLHDMELVKEHFPKTLLLARHFYCSGATKHILTKDNMKAAVNVSQMWEAVAGHD